MKFGEIFLKYLEDGFVLVEVDEKYCDKYNELRYEVYDYEVEEKRTEVRTVHLYSSNPIHSNTEGIKKIFSFLFKYMQVECFSTNIFLPQSHLCII